MILDVHAELLSMSLQHTVSQEVELALRDFADSCLLLVHREPQLAHDLPQFLQGRFGLAPSAQDHEVVRVGYEASAEGSFTRRLVALYPGCTGDGIPLQAPR